jgi:hypothetical protein
MEGGGAADIPPANSTSVKRDNHFIDLQIK